MPRPAYINDDLRLADLCSSGDEAAQREFFRRELGHVHATLYRILGANSELDDLVQEAFFEIFRSLPSFRGESSLATWLDRITVRVAYAHLARRRPPTTRLELVPEPRAKDPSAEERALMREAARRLYRVLDRLEPKKRVAFTLHVIEGRSLKDTALVMGSSVVLAKVRVWRAWQFVKKCARSDAALASLFETNHEEKA
jgi:RNA polymerase sigma-70 factor (ECF subfamily)